MSLLARLVQLALCLIASMQGRACEIVGEMGDTTRITDESAFIVWNQKTHTKQFVRRARFETKAKNFGFLVPTPSRPKLSEVSDSLFYHLEAQLAPKIEQRTRNLYAWTWWSATHTVKTTFNAAADSMSSDEGIDVVEQKRVGDYEATVLRACDTRRLKRWLSAHHYSATSDFEEWASSYVRRGWYLTAFKIVAKREWQLAQLKAICLSFQSEAPFYPYRESKSQGSETGRKLRVFYLGSNRPEAHIESSNQRQRWGAETNYSAPLNVSVLKKDQLALPDGALRLTAFTDSSSPRLGWGDLQFAPSSDQGEMTPPPHIALVA